MAIRFLIEKNGRVCGSISCTQAIDFITNKDLTFETSISGTFEFIQDCRIENGGIEVLFHKGDWLIESQ